MFYMLYVNNYVYISTIVNQNTFTMKNNFTNEELCNYVYTLQEFCAEDAIDEIMNAGFSNDEVAYIFREITFNDTFKFLSKKIK